jgi:hypothetical protein
LPLDKIASIMVVYRHSCQGGTEYLKRKESAVDNLYILLALILVASGAIFLWRYENNKHIIPDPKLFPALAGRNLRLVPGQCVQVSHRKVVYPVRHGKDLRTAKLLERTPEGTAIIRRGHSAPFRRQLTLAA